MALYDEIVSPFDYYPNLLKILDIYANEKDKHGNKILFPIQLYKQVINNSRISESEEEIYKTEFNKYVKDKNFNAFFKYLKYATNTINYDETIKSALDKIENDSRMSEDEKKNKIRKYKDFYLYPISDFTPILNSFKDYHEFIDFYNKSGFDKYEEDLINIIYYPSKYTVEDFLKKNGLPYDMYFIINKMLTLYLKMNKKFSGGPNIMGFHVNPQSINLSNNKPRERSDIKFYLNAGPDTFEVAYLFQKECIKNKINYYYKVTNPYRGESVRCDKMCIYSNYEDAEVFLDIIKKIRKEHPEIKFDKPPIFSGLVDGFIGVGQDNIHNTEFKESFNNIMSQIVFESIQETFKDVKREDIMKVVKTDKNKLLEFRNKIIEKGEEIGIDTSKMCINNDAKKRLKNKGYGVN